MTDLSRPQTVAASSQPSPPFRPWKPRRWTRRNTPNHVRLVPDKRGILVIPREDLAFLLNASTRDILAWRHEPGFPAERRYGSHKDAVGYEPDELVDFLTTLPLRDQARVCPALPLGPVNALGSGLHFRFVSLAFQPTLKELLVAGSVMIATATISLFGIMAAAG